ncbi:MAG: Gfo/Idh/MocA family oxidoreductase [Anaerolineae bacterium]
MATRKIPFGVIGLGLMGREFAVASARWPALLDLDVQPEIVAICDTVSASFDWFQRNFPTIRLATTNYQELLADPAIEAIYCAVPHFLHAQMYVDIIRAGKHLLGEKPFGMDMTANQAIVSALDENPQVFAACSSEFPFFPGAQRLIRLINENQFGQIIEVNAGLLHSSDLDPTKKLNWKRQVSANGEYGCMGDLGFHTLHIPLRAGWVPETVASSLVKIVRQRPNAAGEWVPCDTWDNATLTCRVLAGEQAFPMTLQTYRISPGDANTWFLRIIGTRMSAEYSTKRPKTLRMLRYETGQEQAWTEVDLGMESGYRTISGSIFEFGFGDSLLQMWAAFCDELAHGRQGMRQPFYCGTPAETLLQHKVLTAALQSNRDRRTVSLEEAN